MSSIITLAVSVGVGGRPAAAPQNEPFEIVSSVTKETTFVDAINAVSVVVLAYAGTPNFLNIVGEMRDQRGKPTSPFLLSFLFSPSFEFVAMGLVDILSQTTQRASSPVSHS